MSDAVLVEVGVAGAGLAAVLHQSPLWLPNIRPFNCMPCLSGWLACLLMLSLSDELKATAFVYAFAVLGTGYAAGAVAVTAVPWLARDFSSK